MLPLLIVLGASLLYLWFFRKEDCSSPYPQRVYQEDNALPSQMEMNRTITLLKARIGKHVLNNRLCGHSMSTIVIRSLDSFPYLFGKIHGEPIGEPFNDSATAGFDSSYLLEGFRRYKDYDGDKYTYQFIYRSKLDNKPVLEGGKRPQSYDMLPLPKFHLNSKGKIYRVNGTTVRLMDGPAANRTIINGLKFHSDCGEISPSSPVTDGVPFSEEYPGYSIHSVRGYMNKYIHQIQFVWYYTKPI